MSHPSFLVTFPHGLRPDLPLRGERVPVAGEVLVLDDERWVVDVVEWTTGEDRFVLRPTVHTRPTWGLRADLLALTAAAAVPAETPEGDSA